MDAVTIKKLGLGMFEKWQVLGVVSENDYTKNLRGESVDLNFKEIKNISISKRDKLMESKLLARKILQKYSATMAPRHREFTADASGMTNNKNIVARSEVAILEHFEPSASIFIDQVETPVEDNPRNPPESIDRCIYSAMKAFARFLDKRPLSLPTTEPSSKSILSSDVGATNAPSSSSSNTHKVSSFSGHTRCFRHSGRVFKWRRYTPPELHGPTVGTVMEVNNLATSTKSKGKKRSISDSGLDNPNKRFKHQSGVRAKKKKVQSGNDSVPSVDSSSRSSRQAAGKESKPKFNKTIRVSASREARKALGMHEQLSVGALGPLQQQPFQSYLGDLSMTTALDDMNVNDPGSDCGLDDFLAPNLVDEVFASIEGDQGRGTAKTKTRTKNVGNICLEAVTDKFKPVTITMGPLFPLLERSLPRNFSHQSNAYGDAKTFMKEDWKSVAEEICSTFEGMAKLWSEMRAIGALILQHYVNKIMTKEWDSSQETLRDQRWVELQSVLEPGFFQNLVFSLYRPGPNRRKAPGAECATKALKQFSTDFRVEFAGIQRRLQGRLDGQAPGKFLEQIARNLEDMVGQHIRQYLLELKHRVKVLNPEWANKAGSPVLNDLDEQGRSPLYGPVQIFWLLNSRIPANHRFEFMPRPGFQDVHCAITESHYLTAILRARSNTREQRLLRQKLYVLFAPPDDHLLSRVRAQVKTPPGTLPSTQHLQRYPGELFYKMFFARDKRNNYERKTVVITTSDPAIPNLFKNDPHSILETITTIEKMPKGQEEQRRSMASRLKGAIQCHVEEQRGQSDTMPKYVLWGTICTDGYVCNQLATCLYEKDKAKAKKSKSKIGSCGDNENRPKLQYLRHAIKDEASYQKTFGTGPKEHLIAAGDPGIANTLTLTKLNSRSGQQCNTSLSRGTHEFSSKWYKRLVERLKASPDGGGEQSIQELENGIEAAVDISDVQATDAIVMAEVHESFCAHIGSVRVEA
ncbi:hypothetical protein BGW38_006110 [Lunasporangiospora selenospora]|uniref:Uncharacterized protein n=1 Tax=Lunasporangiospora selenospora TaxID=979761 RepID=A0A9P6FP36_9FUNG|nr:hypothetical protein BGW38_006110 [Lunasporangiospora selenospora]